MPETALTLGVDHIGLAVQNLEASAGFFTNCLGWKQIGGKSEYPALFVSDGHSVLTLWQVEDPQSSVGFDRRKNIGLHHLALKVANEATLNRLFEAVAGWPGVSVEFPPEPSGAGPKIHTMIREPGGVRVEFAYDPR
jgi:catechol 2,3-dioxygenase-like lactoylglutathione lyase family enzyme